jgi:two-component system NtrC family sensor kinase
MSNALDAIGPQGTLSIKAGQRDSAYCITVCDTGEGIPKDERERVLEPFFTTKPVGQGTGLGLSITYNIVKKHGGTLEIDDAPGGGARVTISLPLPEAEACQGNDSATAEER